MCIRFARAFGSVVSTCEGRYSVASLWRRAFVNLVIMRPSGACRRISLLDVGYWDISYDTVGMESRSELIDREMNVVCLGCHP